MTNDQENDASFAAETPRESIPLEGADAAEGGSSRMPTGIDDHLDIDAVSHSLAEANERYVRLQAELDNYRKRARRELDDSLRYAQLPLLRDVLGVLDNLTLALNAAADNEGAKELVEGVRMVSDQMNGVLAAHHCFAIEAIGQPFDPNQHEAVQMEASAEYPANTVSRELRRGYRLHDRVIRPAQVFVSTGAAQ